MALGYRHAAGSTYTAIYRGVHVAFVRTVITRKGVSLPSARGKEWVGGPVVSVHLRVHTEGEVRQTRTGLIAVIAIVPE